MRATDHVRGEATGIGATTPRRVASGATGVTTRPRSILHIAVGALGWLAFAGLWIWQLRVHVPADWLAGIQLIALLIVATAVFTPTWVRWNRSIYRRRHRRTTPLLREVDFSRDALGREVVATPDALGAAAQVLITIEADGSVKRYAAASGPRQSAVGIPVGEGVES